MKRLGNFRCLQVVEYTCPETLASAEESREVAGAVNGADTTASLTALGMSKTMATKVPALHLIFLPEAKPTGLVEAMSVRGSVGPSVRPSVTISSVRHLGLPYLTRCDSL